MEEMEDSLRVCPRCGYDETRLEQEGYYLPPGTILGGRYIVGRVISYWGFTVKYLGMDAAERRKVILSEYLPGDFSTRSQGDREVTIYSGDAVAQFKYGLMNFLNEGKRLQNMGALPGIPTVYACFTENYTGYIVSEYLEGETLEAILSSGKWYRPEDAVQLINPILVGLNLVHQQEIYHCDICPENILISPTGEAKLLNFGATRYVTTASSKSLAITLKQGYAPEEQYRTQEERGSYTDVYAMGAVLYRMMTGQIPQESVERALEDRLAAPSKLGISIASNIENALMNSLNVFYWERTPTAGVFYQELNNKGTKRIKVKKRKKEIGKTPVWIKVLVVILVCAIVAGVIVLYRSIR
jgi:serine/threonine protein kinase